MNRRQYAIALAFSISLLTVALIPLSGQQGSSYNPWLDYDDSGTIDVEDLHALGQAYGTSGTPLNMPMALAYDSGWIDISNKQGQYFDMAPGFNLETSTWTPRIYGKATADTLVHQKYWYADGMPGWNKTYGGTNTAEGRSTVQTSDGGYVMTGNTGSLGLGNQVYLVKTSADGVMEWNQTYGGASWDMGYSVIQTSDGGYAIVGGTNSFGSGYQMYSVKTDPSGTMLWNKTYGGTGREDAYSVIQTADGGYAIAGSTNSFGAGTPTYHNVYLVRTSADGSMTWNKTYGGGYHDFARSMIQTSDGGYAIAGYSNPTGSDYGAYLVKTDASGTMIWEKRFEKSLTYDDFARSVIQTSDGGYAIAGSTQSSYSLSSADPWFVKTDSSGIMEWSKTYGGTDRDEFYSLAQTSDGGYAIAGITYSYGVDIPSYPNVYLVRTYADGTEAWVKWYGGAGDDHCYSLVKTNEGGYALAGWAASPNGWQFCLIKTDALGFANLEYGVTIASYTADAVTFYRGEIDPYYNYIRVQIWVVKETP